MNYTIIKEEDVERIASLYIEYYNQNEEGCWTKEKAVKRIHQMVAIEDSLCLIQWEEATITGFVLGYYKEYDDLTSYMLEEIVIRKEYQNKGYGSAFLEEIEKRALFKGALHLELLSVNDEHHIHFYEKFGMKEATNLKLYYKHYLD